MPIHFSKGPHTFSNALQLFNALPLFKYSLIFPNSVPLSHMLSHFSNAYPLFQIPSFLFPNASPTVPNAPLLYLNLPLTLSKALPHFIKCFHFFKCPLTFPDALPPAQVPFHFCKCPFTYVNLLLHFRNFILRIPIHFLKCIRFFETPSKFSKCQPTYWNDF